MVYEDVLSWVSGMSGMTRTECDRIIKALGKTISNALNDEDSLSIPGFGSFKMKEYKERNVHDINTGGLRKIPARKVPSFTPYEGFYK